MKPLSDSFTSKKFNFTLIKREGDIALYERKREGWVNPGYEVIRVRKYPTYEIGGATVEAHEAFPPDEEWGQEGWSLPNLERANEKFFEQVKLNPNTTIIGESKGTAPGRKRSDFEIEVPTDHEFTVKELQEKYVGRSVPFIHIRLNELIEAGKVIKSGTKPSPRGKPTNLYRAVPLNETPQILK